MVLKYHKPTEREDYILEEKFGDQYELDKKKEMKDISYIFNKFSIKEFCDSITEYSDIFIKETKAFVNYLILLYNSFSKLGSFGN